MFILTKLQIVSQLIIQLMLEYSRAYFPFSNCHQKEYHSSLSEEENKRERNVPHLLLFFPPQMNKCSCVYYMKAFVFICRNKRPLSWFHQYFTIYPWKLLIFINKIIHLKQTLYLVKFMKKSIIFILIYFVVYFHFIFSWQKYLSKNSN